MSDSRNALYAYNEIAQALTQKWAPLVESIENEHLRLNTSVLLENEAQKGTLLTEDPVFPSVSGTFSGQTANAGGFDFSAGDGTGSGADISPFQHYLLPLVRRVYPNLIANELVGVQPMTSPASLVFYLKYKYTGLVDPDVVSNGKVTETALQKGTTAAGTEYGNFSGNTWSIDPYYSLQTVFREPYDADGTVAAAYAAGGTAVLTYTPQASPVVEGSVVESTVISVTVAGDTTAAANDTYTVAAGDIAIDTDTGVVTLTLNAAPTGDGTFTVDSGSITYDYNMEGNRALPEMELQVESFPVAAKTRKLRTKWTIEASQDLRAMHNIDAEQELIAVLANEVTAEIDREIINDLIVNALIRVDYDYSSPFVVGGVMPNTQAQGFTGNDFGDGGTFVPGIGTAATQIAIPGVTSFDDRNKALFYQILEVSNQIYRQSLRGAGNWVVTSPEVAAKLESLLEFKPDARTDTTYNLGIIYSGTLNGQFKLYKDPLFPTNLILIGYKGSSFMDSGYFYCPYVPLQLTPTVLDDQSFNPRKGLITRYGKVMVENGDRMYGVIRVGNMTAVGANRLPGSDTTGTSAQRSGNTITNNVASSDLI